MLKTMAAGVLVLSALACNAVSGAANEEVQGGGQIATEETTASSADAIDETARGDFGAAPAALSNARLIKEDAELERTSLVTNLQARFVAETLSSGRDLGPWKKAGMP